MNLTNASGTPVAGAHLRLEANMSHAGMAPVFTDAKEIEPGQYRALLELSMAGDWYVVVHVSLTDGRTLDQQFELKGVGPRI